jgi:hypothetical protein
MDIPIKKDDKESITEATVVLSPLAMLGKAGRYISIDKGPIAANSPKINIRKNCGCFFT